MKKIISAFIVIAMLASLFCFNVFALTDSDYYFTITASKTADIKAGDEISAYVTLSTSDSVNGVQFYVKYDATLFDGPYTYYDEDNEENVEVGYADDFDKTFPSLSKAKRLNRYPDGLTNMTLDKNSGTFGGAYVRNSTPITTANATTNMVVIGVKLTAKVDIPDGAKLWTEKGACVIDRSVTGEPNHSIKSQPSLTFTATAAEPTATPTVAPTATPTVAPTVAPAIVENNVPTESNTIMTAADVAEKAFTAFAKIEGIEDSDLVEFGIVFLATDEEVDADKVIAEGTEYKAKGKLLDGSFAVRLENGDGTVDYFDKLNVGIITYMKTLAGTIYGAFTSLK